MSTNLNEKILEIALAFGGTDNIKKMEISGTVLIATMGFPGIVDRDRLVKELGASKAERVGENDVHVTFGDNVAEIKETLIAYSSNKEAGDYINKRIMDGGNMLMKNPANYGYVKAK